VSGSPSRPGYHFTAPAGWINDPHGIRWHPTADGGRYDLFFQYNPDAPEWVAACRWGRTSAPDLVRWGPVDVALQPEAGEAGCWTGSVVVDDGRPVIVYTSVRAGDLDVGSVVLAEGDRDWRAWSGPRTTVLPGPPPGLDPVVFRDPHVERDGEGWRMVIGAGTVDRRALALLYRSPDLRTWRYEGVLAERSADDGPPGTGSAWECAQFFRLDGRWVLVVSVWEAGETLRVVAAVGDVEGTRFTPAAWRRLGATDVPYATTTFLDAAGRRCALSWLRGIAPAGNGSVADGSADGPAGWAGALSLPWVLGVRGNRLVQVPHPDVATLRTGVLGRLDGEGALGPLPPGLDIEFDVSGPAVLELGAGPPALTVAVDGSGAVRLTVPGEDPVHLGDGEAESLGGGAGELGRGAGDLGRGAGDLGRGAGAGDRRVRVLVDGGLVEVATAGEGAALLAPVTGPLEVALRGPGRVVVHGMPGAG
jgi:beta-fructofuranosidase